MFRAAFFVSSVDKHGREL